MGKNRQKLMIRIETIIIIIIAFCIIFLNAYMTDKIFLLEKASEDAMFIKEGLEFPESEELGSELVKYRPDAYKMIEMYNSSYELVFSIQFEKNLSAINGNLKDYPDLINVLNKQTAGQISVERQDKFDERVYFQWVYNDHNEKRLIIIYSTKEKVVNVWVFSLVCYIVLVLIFALLIVSRTKLYIDKIEQYREITSNSRQEVYRR